MKTTPSLHRAHSPRPTGRQDTGVTLVTVLAMVLLLSVLVLSFFEVTKTELNASLKDSENLKARAFADAAVNIVISQIREATTQKSTNGEYAPWSSQPGALRVYQPYGDLKAIFKLYSSSRMLADSFQQLERDDLRRNWDSEPDHWVDMNAPVVIPGIPDEKNVDQAEVYWPIVDPRAARPQRKDSVEGFNYKSGVNGVVAPGNVRPKSQRLPMPVQWLYLLADGTIGTLNKAGAFVAPIGGGEPSKANPIVGRTAFWTDDETCKININTASEGVYWDTPRASTDEDRWLGQSQPVNGEWQRYPGHPAMVCMSSVLFPNRRLRALKSESASPVGTTIPMQDMRFDEAQSIWRMSPFIYGEDDDKSSFGGHRKPVGMAIPVTGNHAIKTLPSEPTSKHLYHSCDDYLIASDSDRTHDGKTPAIQRRESDRAGRAVTKLPLDRIQQGRFFLTARSSAPEITLGGLPRMSLWPIDYSIISELTNNKAGSFASGSKYSVFDTLIGFNTSMRREATVYPYFYQRWDPWSWHHEFYNVTGPRNKALFDFLSTVSKKNIPGFGLRAADPSGTNFKNFGDKYGATRFDDCEAIIVEMIDYIRHQNLEDANLMVANRYAPESSGGEFKAYGQVAPICLCGGSGDHASIALIASSPVPKGSGRFLTVSEVALVVGLRAKQTGGAAKPEPVPFHPDHKLLVGNPPPAGTDFYEIEAGLLHEGFCCAQGWSEFRPEFTITLGGFSGSETVSRKVSEGPDETTDRIIAQMDLCGKQLVYDSLSSGNTSVASTAAWASGPRGPVQPKDFIAWGGTLGARFYHRMITFKPLLFSVPTGGSLPPFSFSGTLGSGNHLRLMVYTGIVSAPPTGELPIDTDNLIQLIPLAFPENRGGYPLPTSNPRPFRTFLRDGSTLPDRLQQSRGTGILYGTDGLIHPGDIVQSLVPNHGDVRLLAFRRAVMQGRGSGVANASAREFPTFVAHPNYGRKGYPLAHSLTEPKPEMNAAVPRRPIPGIANDFGYFPSDSNSVDLRLRPEYILDFVIKPWEENVKVRLIGNLSAESMDQGAISGGREMTVSMKEAFNMTRYDRLGTDSFRRGLARPDVTGDFDTGVGPSIDGPYTNHGDGGEVRGAQPGGVPYFSHLDVTTEFPKANAAIFSPNRVIPSAGAFGSLPTGVQENVPWQTLLFRPDLELASGGGGTDRQHYGSRYPRDHLFMDMFWMPVVQPYAISLPFETKGKINMNYQILPFTYITRATALHALFKSEKVMAIPDERAHDYKIGEKEGGEDTPYKVAEFAVFRHFIDAEQTLKQWEERFAGTDQASVSRGIKPGAFLSTTEICDAWLVPCGQTREGMVEFWRRHRLTGDNVKERPYATLYPRLTTRSNAYRVHVVAQSLRKAKYSDPRSFPTDQGDTVTAEYRGSYLVERWIDPTDPDIPDYATKVGNLEDYEPLDTFYSYRISQVKQFVR